MNDLVSILIPAYNSEKWLSSTIKSASDQSYTNIEIIIVDDGSSDHTYDVAKRFESKNIKVIKQCNKGASAARNEAFNHAQGSYIQWLDADDLLSPDKIFNQINNAENGLNSNILLSSTFGTFYYRKSKAKFIKTELWNDLLPVDWIIKKFNKNIWMNPATWLVSRKISELSGLWNEKLSFDDDGEYFCRVVSNSKKIKFVNTSKCFYRQVNELGISKNTSDKACRSLLFSLSSCFNTLLAIEDSKRTRNACINYLQTWYSYFYLNPVFTEKAKNIAINLGGILNKPTISKRQKLFINILGKKGACKLINRLHKSKIILKSEIDKLFFDLGFN